MRSLKVVRPTASRWRFTSQAMAAARQAAYSSFGTGDPNAIRGAGVDQDVAIEVRLRSNFLDVVLVRLGVTFQSITADRPRAGSAGIRRTPH